MKYILLLITSSILLSSSCKKQKSDNPVDQLPPETQTGENTFGCLVNGQIFKPGGSSLSGPNLSAIYQYLYPGLSDGYVFGVDASDKRNSCNITGIGFRFDSTSINGNMIYQLANHEPGKGGGV